MDISNDLEPLLGVAARLRDEGHGNLITYSRKVFIPLTHLCRDVCHYCTFAQTPKRVASPYLSIDEVLATARRGAEMGCKEALFTLGVRAVLLWHSTATAGAIVWDGLRRFLESVAGVIRHLIRPS